MKYISMIGVAVVLLFFWVLGLAGHPGTDKFVTENLYEALHPCSVVNAFGVLLFHAAAFYISGAWKYIIGEQSLPVGSVWTNIAAFVVGFAGILFIWA